MLKGREYDAQRRGMGRGSGKGYRCSTEYKGRRGEALDDRGLQTIDERGEAEARSTAIREQRQAHRARSRKHYAFWVAVASAIDARKPDAPNLIQ